MVALPRTAGQAIRGQKLGQNPCGNRTGLETTTAHNVRQLRGATGAALRSANFLGAFRDAAEREPRRERRKFFILRPRRTKRLSQFCKSAQKRDSLAAERLLRDLQKLPLSYFHGGEPGTFRGTGKGFAEKFS